MSTILASALIDKAAIILQDTTNITWPRAELLGWLNAGQQDIVLYKPNASVKNAVRKLDAGTRQTLPTDAIALLELVRNMGTTGGTPGRAIRVVSREVLDAQVPDWHSADPSSEVKHYVFNEADPKHYYVYPPNTGSGYVEEVYCCTPATVAEGQPIALDDIYANILLDYILYRGYSKDTDYAADIKLADVHFQAYTTALRGKVGAEQVASPNRRAPANKQE